MGVEVFLYSEDVPEVDCPVDSGSGPGERKPLCLSVSDADGVFKFKSLPCGKCNILHLMCHMHVAIHWRENIFCSSRVLYSIFDMFSGTYELVPYYKGENTVFEVSPPSISVTVEHHHVAIPQIFQVCFNLSLASSNYHGI